MKPVNLIPLERQRASKRKIANRKWMQGTGLYCIAVIIATICSRVFTTDPGIVIAQQIKDTQDKIIAGETKLIEINNSIKTAQVSLIANQQLRDQPNWSVLLKLIASKMGKSIVLTRCDLIPIFASEPAKQGHVKEPISYDFIIEGQGRSMIQINTFVLSLEETKIFNQVNLDESHHQLFSNTQSNYFRLRCVLGSGKQKR